MKVFRVIGWYQYKSDCAIKFERVQLAQTEQEALADATSPYRQPNYRVVAEIV